MDLGHDHQWLLTPLGELLMGSFITIDQADHSKPTAQSYCRKKKERTRHFVPSNGTTQHPYKIVMP